MNLNKTLKVSISIQGYTQKPQGKEVAQIRYIKQTLTIQQLIDYISAGHCITHCFEDYDEEFGQSTKKIENFHYTQLIGIDIDDADVDLNTYISSIRYKPTLAYTTFSHNIKGNRYRLLYIFNEKIKGAEHYCNVYKWLTQDLNLKDNCMQSCAQQMYGTNANAEWYITDTTYDIPTECKTTYGQQCKSKVSQRKAKYQKQSDKCNPNIIERENTLYSDDTHHENDTLVDNTVVKALYGMSPQDFIFYYHNTFEYFTSTPLHYEDGYALIPEDYYEVKRPWYKDKVGDKTITVVKTIRDGEQRRKRLCNTAIILRAIKRDISFEHLLYILVCERQYYYDNQDKALSNKELINIAKWSIELPSEQINPKKVKHSKFKVDKSYWAEKGITARQAANIVRGIIKSEAIGSMYDFNLTDKENIQVMKDNGLKVSLRTLKQWRKDNGIKVSNEKQSDKSKVSQVQSEYNNRESTHYIGTALSSKNDTLLAEGNNNNTTHKQMKKDNIKEWYNPQLTDDENIKVLKDNGINISAITLKRWRKANGIAKQRGGDHCSQSYKQSDKSKVSFEGNQSDTEKSSSQKQSIISDQSIKIKVSNPDNNQSITIQSKYQNQVFKQNEYLKSSVQNQVVKSEIKCSSEKNQVVKDEKQSDTFTCLEELEEKENIDLNKIPSSINDEKTLQLYANAYLKEMATAKAWPAFTRNREKYHKVMKNASSSIKSDVINIIKGKYQTIETDRIEWIGIHVASILPYDSAYDELYNHGYLPKNSNMYWQQYFKKNNAVCEAV